MSNNNNKKKKVVIKQPPQNVQYNNRQQQNNQNRVNNINTNPEDIDIIEEEIVEEIETEVEETEEILENETSDSTEEIEEELEENFQQPPQTKENFEHMYRVRLEWGRPDTQIFSSPVLEEAIKQASAHEGYKVFVDDDGRIENNPWIPKEVEVQEENPLKEVIHPLPGHSITLDNTPVFKTAIDKHPFNSFSGEYYFYDRTITNGRAKITTHKRIPNPDPSLIFGYIKIE